MSGVFLRVLVRDCGVLGCVVCVGDVSMIYMCVTLSLLGSWSLLYR